MCAQVGVASWLALVVKALVAVARVVAAGECAAGGAPATPCALRGSGVTVAVAVVVPAPVGVAGAAWAG